MSILHTSTVFSVQPRDVNATISNILSVDKDNTVNGTDEKRVAPPSVFRRTRLTCIKRDVIRFEFDKATSRGRPTREQSGLPSFVTDANTTLNCRLADKTNWPIDGVSDYSRIVLL